MFVCYVSCKHPDLFGCILGLHDNKVHKSAIDFRIHSKAAHGLVGVQKQRSQIDVVIEDHMPKIHKNSSTL